MTGRRMTEAQRRIARRAIARNGELTPDRFIPGGTWRRLLGRMWRAGWIEAPDQPRLTSAGRTEAFR